MLLQQIIFPKSEICEEEELYIVGNYKCVDGQLKLTNGQQCSFGTYFNSFSVKKWCDYTIIKNLYLHLRFQGKLRIRLLNADFIKKQVQKTIIDEKIIEKSEDDCISLEFPDIQSLEGIVYFSIESMSDETIFIDAKYETDNVAILNNINLKVAICTFKREEFVHRNLEVLRSYITENPKSILYDHFSVIVSDNGKTLDVSDMRNIDIYPNMNFGGSGGFTRGMIETLRLDYDKNISHIVMMDDDVLFEPSIFEKLYAFLTLLKPEYQYSTVGGAMLKLNNKKIQHEKGAFRSSTGVEVHGQNLDLSIMENVILNEKEKKTNFSGWWFSCVSITEIREDNLPLPLFIHGDDVEFGLRNTNSIIFLNGIGVWHSTENKESSVLAYYDNRNDMIINAIHSMGNLKQEKKRLFMRMVVKAMRYRYKDAYLIAKAADDFCNGIDWLKETDALKLHGSIGELGYRNEIDFSDCDIEHVETEDMSLSFYIKLLINFMLPACKKEIIVDNTVNSNNFFLRKRLGIADSNSKKGYRLKKSYIELWKVLKEFHKVSKVMDDKYEHARQEYFEQKKEIMCMDFWEKYLKLQ